MYALPLCAVAVGFEKAMLFSHRVHPARIRSPFRRPVILAIATVLTLCEPAAAAQCVWRNGLAFARGQSFATLASYLAHLRREARRDVAWYRLGADGRYRLAGRGRPRTKSWSRADLMRKFGFTC